MRDQQTLARHPAQNNGGGYMFNSPQTNQHQSGWAVGQVQHVAMQQQHPTPLHQQQQQQQQQRRPQHHQQQPRWGAVITSGSTLPLVGQQQQQQQLRQPQQQLQPWGGQYAQSQSQQQQQLLLQAAHFTPSVIRPQPHFVQVQSNHRSTPHAQQHNLQSIHSTIVSQSYPSLQCWSPHTPTAGGQPLISTANGASSLPWGQQPRGSGISPAAKAPTPTAGGGWSSKTGSITSSSGSFNGTGTPGNGVASSRRDSFAGNVSRDTPPRYDGVSNKRARKRKSRATGTVSPANKGALSTENRFASRTGAIAVNKGEGISALLDESDSRDNGDRVPRVQPCEPCEKEFNSESARKAHLESHVMCEEDGCGFSALPKVVNCHHEIKHGQFNGSGFQIIDVEGQKFRVLLGTCPEEVEQWRAARKKLWPTSANIARKNEQMEKRRQLGDLGPDTGLSGRGRGRGRGKGRGRGRGGSMRGGQPILESASADDTQKNGENVVGDFEKGTPAKVEPLGEGGVSETGSGVGVDEGLEAGEETRKRNTRLCSFYLRGKCTKGEACNYSHDVERRPCGYFMKGNCFRGKACTFIHDFDARAKERLETRDAADGSPGKADKKRAAKRFKAERDAMRQVESKPTLLRNLLTPQLHRESSIALQAVRFIVQSNFFLDPAPTKADREPSDPSPSEAGTATAAADTADTSDVVSTDTSASTDGLPSEESQSHAEDEGLHKLVAKESAESVASTLTFSVSSVAGAESAIVISGAAVLATGTSTDGLRPEDQCGDSAGSIQSRAREDGPHQMVDMECVESAVVPGDAAAVVAECANDTSDAMAALTVTSPDGLLPEDQCGDADVNTKRSVEEELQTVKTESLATTTVTGVGTLVGADVSTDSSAASAAAVVATATKVDGLSPEDKINDAAGTSQSFVEEKNPQQNVEMESLVSTVPPGVADMASTDVATDSRDAVAVATSTDGVVPEDQRGDAAYISPKSHAEDKPHETVEKESVVLAAAPKVGVAGVDIATDNKGANAAATGGKRSIS